MRTCFLVMLEAIPIKSHHRDYLHRNNDNNRLANMNQVVSTLHKGLQFARECREREKSSSGKSTLTGFPVSNSYP